MTKEQDQKFIRQAIELGRQGMANNLGGPFGALVVKEGFIIGRGWNQVTSANDPTAHAEVIAIREACHHLKTFQLTGCVLYTSCEPCPMCLGAIYWARPDRFVFAAARQDAANGGFDDQFMYQEFSLAPNERSIQGEQLFPDEGKALFDEWLTKEDRIDY